MLRSFRVLFVYVLLALLAACQPIQPAPAAAAPAAEAAAATHDLTEEEAAALAVVEAFAELSASHGMTLANLNEYLAFYAPDAVMTTLGIPDRTVWEGISGVRRYYMGHDASEGNVNTIEIINVEGDTVVARTLSEGTVQRELGIPPWEVTEIFVVKDGLIQSDAMATTPDLLVQALDAAAQAGYDVRASAPSAAIWVEWTNAVMDPALRAPLTVEKIDPLLELYSDDVVFTILGLPGGTQLYTGKEAVRGVMEQWAAEGMTLEYEPIMVWMNTVTGRAAIGDPNLEAMGVAPLVGIDVMEFRKGLVVREWWAIAPDSLKVLLAASATAPQ